MNVCICPVFYRRHAGMPRWADAPGLCMARYRRECFIQEIAWQESLQRDCCTCKSKAAALPAFAIFRDSFIIKTRQGSRGYDVMRCMKMKRDINGAEEFPGSPELNWRVWQGNKKSTRTLLRVPCFFMVAGIGFEPMTFGL